MIIFNEESNDIVDERHVCFFTKEEGFTISLMEMIEKKIKHPSAPEHAFVFKYDTKLLRVYKRTEFEAAATILLEAAQNNISNILNK